MENQNNNLLSDEQKAERVKKRKESQKFLKIYMISFFTVVIALISLSYFAQEKLNNQIEQLTIEANSNRQEALTHASSAENLQKYLDEQENLITEQNDAIDDMESQVEQLQGNIEILSAELAFYEEFLIMEQYFNDQNYVGCIPLLIAFYSSESFENAEKNILTGDDSALIYTNIVVKTYEITNEFLENEEILQQISAEQIENLQNLQNKG